MPRTAVVSAVITAAVLVVGFVSTPSHERHREAIKQAVEERRPIVGLLGLGAVAAIGTEYHHLGVLSYTKLNDRVVSVGALGGVRVLERRKDE